MGFGSLMAEVMVNTTVLGLAEIPRIFASQVKVFDITASSDGALRPPYCAVTTKLIHTGSTSNKKLEWPLPCQVA